MVRKRLVVYSQDLELAQADGIRGLEFVQVDGARSLRFVQVDGVRSLEFVQGDAVVTFRTGSLGLAGDA